MIKTASITARFFSPGSFTANTWDQPITSTDPMKVAWPEDAYAFSIHEREDIVVDGKRYTGESRQVGPLYFHPDSKLMTLEQAAIDPASTSTLLWNMKTNGWNPVIWTRFRNWPQPFNNKDHAILSRSAS